MGEVMTTCPYCGCGCNMVLRVTEGKITGVTPAKGHPVSGGSLCVKGWNAHEFVHSPDRLGGPLIRRDGRLCVSSWDEAMNRAVSGLQDIVARYGPDAVAFFSSAKVTNEENFLMMKLARAVFGTNNVDHCARLCHSSTVVGLAETFGSGAMTNTIGELASADCIFVIGSNTTEQHPQAGARIIECARRGGIVIVADPRAIRLTRFARLHMRQRPGTDVALMNSMMHVILAEKLEKREFIDARTENFEAMEQTARAYPPQRGQEITGVPAEQIIQAARLYASAASAALVYSMGITQHTHGVDNVRTTANLAMLTGNLGRPSTGVNPLRGQNNVQGACDMGALPNVYSGYQKVVDPAPREAFGRAWGRTLPEKPGLTVVDAIHAAAEGRIKAIYIMGENPMMSDPDIRSVEAALGKLELLVVQDIFLTETARLAHVVLAGASFAEKDGTFTNTERRVQRVRKAIEPVINAREDWRILGEIARRAGYEGMRYGSAEEIFREMAALTPSYRGMSYPRLEPWGLHWPCPDAAHPGTPILHKAAFTRGKGKFSPAEFKPSKETPDAEYDLILTTGRLYVQWHTGTMSRRTTTLERESPEAFVEMHPEDAQQRGIRSGRVVRVTTRRGSLEMKARVTPDMSRGVVFIPFHFCESAVNRLTNPVFDPESRIPEYKSCAAKVEVGA